MSKSLSYTAGEQQALAVIVEEIDRRKACSLSHDQVSRLARVGKTTVRSAINKAAQLGAIKVTRREGEPNVIRRA